MQYKHTVSQNIIGMTPPFFLDLLLVVQWLGVRAGSREPSPFRSWPNGFDPYRKYNSPSACAVSEPQSANGNIRLINVEETPEPYQYVR